MVGAGVLVVALVVVATLALTGGPDKASVASPQPTPTPSQRPTPSLDDALSDPAPVTLDTLLPDETVTVSGHAYQPKLRRASTDCAGASGLAYASAMRTELCGQLLRATYTGPDGVDVTVGVAVFDSRAQVDHVVGALRHVGSFSDPFLLPMPAPEMTRFTVDSGPLSKARPIGRYLVLGVAAYADGHAFTRADADANYALNDLFAQVESTLRARVPTPSPGVTVGG